MRIRVYAMKIRSEACCNTTSRVSLLLGRPTSKVLFIVDLSARDNHAQRSAWD